MQDQGSKKIRKLAK